MMGNKEIKEKAWEEIRKYINLDDETFNVSACSFKISNDYNLVVWCDIEHEERYFIISLRYNPYDELFGADISNLEWSTQDTTKEEFDESIDYLLNSLSNKELVKNSYGDHSLMEIKR
ncbi:MAG: hypothetical protein ACOCRK_07425 [bacterium]